MIHAWKVPHIVKGMLTYVPAMNAWRLRRGTTGGSNSARYCYAVWLRHLVVVAKHGFRLRGAAVGELGPGDSIGTGLAALLGGGGRYVGLDVVPYSASADLEQVLDELAQLYLSRQPIPDHDEFPAVRPRLPSYEFPSDLIDTEALPARIEGVRSALRRGLHNNMEVSYKAPWTSAADVEADLLDLVFSQGVLKCVNDLEATYRAMFAWLKPGGYCSHSTGCAAVHFSPYWNGHWAYSDLEWRLVRGRREWLPNRLPLSAHLGFARQAGFEVLQVDTQYGSGGLAAEELSPRFKHLAADDLATRGAMVVLRKPGSARY